MKGIGRGKVLYEDEEEGWVGGCMHFESSEAVRDIGETTLAKRQCYIKRTLDHTTPTSYSSQKQRTFQREKVIKMTQFPKRGFFIRLQKHQAVRQLLHNGEPRRTPPSTQQSTSEISRMM
jgi:hypothetical protein